MKNGNKSFVFTGMIAIIAFVFAGSIYSQVKEFPAVQMYYSNTDGDANNPVLLNSPPPAAEKSAQEKELERQLDIARLSNNTAAAIQLQQQIDNLKGHVQVHHSNMQTTVVENPGPENEPDYNQSVIHNYSIYSHAFGIAPSNSTVAGRLFCLFSQDSQSGSDTLKLKYSTDNGLTWQTRMWTSMNNYSFNRNEMDIEVIYDGTNTWVFGVIGITDQTDNRKKIYFFRESITGSGYYATMLNFPGSGAGMNYYNPRITSDNANFTSNTYVMILCSMDSLAGSTHYVKQKYALSSSPFDPSPSLNYAQPNGTNGFGWMGNNDTNGNAYLYGDIAYYKDDGGSGENRIMSVYGNYGSGFNSVYVAYLSGYASLGSTLAITETSINKDVKIAFNGGTANRNGMITYVRQFNAADWDIFGFRTTNGGNAPANWVRDTIDYTGDYARSCDLIAVRNANNQFRLCYAQDNSNIPAAYYRSFNGSSWSAKYNYNTSSVDTLFAKPRAGYVLGGGDDGIGLWSLYGGYNGYASRQMITTTGINNNGGTPSAFSLSQNYPNPFNPSTTIKFSVPSAGNVKLVVYNLLGETVATLVNGLKQTGNYEISFSAENLSSGVYFYRIEAGNFSEIKKMMLVK